MREDKTHNGNESSEEIFRDSFKALIKAGGFSGNEIMLIRKLMNEGMNTRDILLHLYDEYGCEKSRRLLIDEALSDDRFKVSALQSIINKPELNLSPQRIEKLTVKLSIAQDTLRKNILALERSLPSKVKNK